jgi:hypothetical protein
MQTQQHVPVFCAMPPAGCQQIIKVLLSLIQIGAQATREAQTPNGKRWICTALVAKEREIGVSV